MIIAIDEIPQSPREIRFSESIEELNELYRRTKNRDFTFPAQLDVEITYYRAGADLFFSGSFSGGLTGSCSRCLEPYRFTLTQRFDFVLTPEKSGAARGAEELHADELGWSYYSTPEINLTPLIMEQVMLALPTRPLCIEKCRGLCGGCGVNLNFESCVCAADAGDPRMAIFRSLKVGR